jgi:hypothetical protein
VSIYLQDHTYKSVDCKSLLLPEIVGILNLIGDQPISQVTSKSRVPTAFARFRPPDGPLDSTTPVHLQRWIRYSDQYRCSALRMMVDWRLEMDLPLSLSIATLFPSGDLGAWLTDISALDCLFLLGQQLLSLGTGHTLQSANRDAYAREKGSERMVSMTSVRVLYFFI